MNTKNNEKAFKKIYSLIEHMFILEAHYARAYKQLIASSILLDTGERKITNLNQYRKSSKCIARLENAMARIVSGEYGYCKRCHKPIWEILKDFPFTVYCAICT